jgi:lipooligosaccharide transport system permease protein
MKPNSLLTTLKLSYLVSHRNWTVYKKDFISNTSPTLADPALILVSLGLGLGGFVAQIDGRTYMQFLAPGLTVATALFTSFFESSYGFYVRMTYENVFKAMLTTPIGAIEVVLGELFWVGLKGALMAFGVAVVLAACGLMANPLLIPLAALVGFLVAVPCGAIGLLATGLVKNINQFQTVYSFLIAPMFYLSGIFFPFQQVNVWIRYLAEIFPLVHGVELAQAIFWNENLGSALLQNTAILGLQSLIYGGCAFYVIRKKLIS